MNRVLVALLCGAKQKQSVGAETHTSGTSLWR